MYVAEITNANSLYVLVNAQLIKQWGDGTTTLNQAPYKIISTRDSIYTGIVDSASKTNLWRYYLPTGGIARDVEFAESGIVEGLAVFSDRIFATVSGGGLYRESTDYVTTGYIITPLADFFTSEKKQWVGAKLNTNVVDIWFCKTVYINYCSRYKQPFCCYLGRTSIYIFWYWW